MRRKVVMPSRSKGVYLEATETVEEKPKKTKCKPKLETVNPAEAASNEWSKREVLKSALDRARVEYIDSNLSSKRKHPELPLTVHVIPFSTTSGHVFTGDKR